MVQSCVRAPDLRFVVVVLVALLGGTSLASAQEAEPAEQASERIPAEQLESLVAPIALYPDDLLAQTLVASTYPLEIIQLQQWLAKNPDLEGEELAQAMESEPWDPSIKSMAAVPEVVERLANDIQWTTDLGNAFLAQQQDVLDAAQSMRKKAQQTGALESGEQMIVEVQVVERDTVIIVQPADPEVIYVPSYNPVVVYGPPPYYAYPPIYYPPPPPAGIFISFSIGVMWGRHWGGPCCGCGWGGNNVYIHRENNFYRIENPGGRDWKHNPEHRGAAPYGDRATADRFGGRTSKDPPRGRVGNEARPTTGTRDRHADSADRDRAGAGDRAGQREGTDRAGTGDRAAQREGVDRADASDRAAQRERTERSGGAPDASRARDGDRPSGAAQRGQSDRVGNREIQRGNESRGGDGLSGGNHRSYDRDRARSSQSRGRSSYGGRRGGGRGGRR